MKMTSNYYISYNQFTKCHKCGEFTNVILYVDCECKTPSECDLEKAWCQCSKCGYRLPAIWDHSSLPYKLDASEWQ